MQALTGGSSIGTIAYQATAASATSSSATKTVSIGIGTASADRWVIVGLQTPTNNPGRTVSSATINGVAATIAYNIPTASTSFGVHVFYALVTAGTGNVTVTAVMTGTTGNQVSRFFTYTVTGRTTLAYVTFTDSGLAASASSRTTTLTCPHRGFNLNFYGASSTATTPVWSGTPTAPTEQSLGVNGINRASVYNGLNGNGVESVVATFSSGNTPICRMTTSSWTYI